jgi:hypothetical protein
MDTIWMPHAGHFICGSQCRFRLNTYVNGYIVSTVGEYVPDSAVRAILRASRGRKTDLRGDAEEADFGFEDIGVDRKYETMVFKGHKSKHTCCPYEMVSGENIDFAGYNDPGEAYKGHMKMIRKWSKK